MHAQIHTPALGGGFHGWLYSAPSIQSRWWHILRRILRNVQKLSDPNRLNKLFVGRETKKKKEKIKEEKKGAFYTDRPTTSICRSWGSRLFIFFILIEVSIIVNWIAIYSKLTIPKLFFNTAAAKILISTFDRV